MEFFSATWNTDNLHLPYRGIVGLNRLDICAFCGRKAQRWTITTDEILTDRHETSSLCGACFDQVFTMSTTYEHIAHDTWRRAGMITKRVTQEEALVLRIMDE